MTDVTIMMMYDDDKFDLTMKLSDIEEQDVFEEKSVSAFGNITKIINERKETG